MSAFSLNIVRAGPSTGEPQLPALQTELPGREAYIRGAGRTATVKLKCNPYAISLRLAHVLRVYEIAQTERISPFICLIARNAGMTYRLLLLLFFTL